MTSERRSTLLVAALIAPLLLVGCSSAPPDPILVGSAPATPTGKINLAIPLDPSGFFVFSKWPNACDLLTDQDVRAVFPQATGILRKATDTKLTVFGNLRSTRYTAPRDVTVPNASCRLAFSLPGVEYDEEFPGSSGYQLTVEVTGAGTEEVVRDNHSSRNTRASLGGADCDISLGTFSCLKGQLEFRLSSGQIHQGRLDGKLMLRYQVGTEVTSFEVGRDSHQARTKFEDDHIRSELVKVVAAKI